MAAWQSYHPVDHREHPRDCRPGAYAQVVAQCPRTRKARRSRAAKRLRVHLLVLYWSKHLVKCEIALGKGKKEYDKRDTERERDSNRELHRAVRNKGKEE